MRKGEKNITILAKTEKAESGFFEPYANFAKILRTWLISYGVGIIVLLVTHKELSELLRTHTEKTINIIGLLLLGIAIQIFLVVLLKYVMAILYYGESDKQFSSKRMHKIADAISEKLQIQFAADLITIFVYAYATYLLSSLVLSSLSSHA